MGKLFQVRKFIQFYFRAQNKYQVHSPFVYELIHEVLENDNNYYIFKDLEKLRNKLKADSTKIQVSDFGAGSHLGNSKIRSVSSIAKSALSSPFFSQFLFKLIHYYKPQFMIEMGTSLGVTSLYQSLANKTARLITLEGCPNIGGLAQKHFDDFNAKNIELKIGEFGQTLSESIEAFPRLDYVYFDGNHKKEPTLEYFELCYKKAHSNSIFVFDDIHWSKGMHDAWEIIKGDQRVTLSIDLFFMGLVFFREEQHEKEDFILVPTKWKPAKW